MHAYASRDLLISGAGILITGGHEAVRLLAGDRVSIETPGGNRLSTVILDRVQGRLRLALDDGSLVRLHASSESDLFPDFKLSDGFSQEIWTVQ